MEKINSIDKLLEAIKLESKSLYARSAAGRASSDHALLQRYIGYEMAIEDMKRILSGQTIEFHIM